MYTVIKYRDLVQPGAGVPDEINYDEDGRFIGFESRKEAEAALKAEYPGKTLEQIEVYAQKRVEARV